MTKRKSRVPVKSNASDTRFNATKHGILSHHTVLPWEDADVYRELHEALIEEYAPDGPTEGHLVEEIAGIMWRKKRLRTAEVGAARAALETKIAQRYRAVKRHYSTFDLFDGDEDEVRQISAAISIPPNQLSAAIEGGAKELAHDASEDDVAAREKDDGETEIDDSDYDEDSEYDEESGDDRKLYSLLTLKDLLDEYREFLEAAQYEVSRGATFEKIARYETHLDRKLERTLTMLLRMQEFRIRSHT